MWVTQHPCCFQNISSTNLNLRIFSLLSNKFNINSYNIKILFMQFVMSNNFTLLRNFIDIINNRYGLIIGAKYYSFIMNDAHTMPSYNIVSCTVKVIWPTAFFSNSRCLFVQLFCWPSASQPGVNS